MHNQFRTTLVQQSDGIDKVVQLFLCYTNGNVIAVDAGGAQMIVIHTYGYIWPQQYTQSKKWRKIEKQIRRPY